MNALDPIIYYSAETTLFPDLSERFCRTGLLTAEELYLILDWKAPRARTRHLKRLSIGRTFSQATEQLANQIHAADDDQQRLSVLLAPEWGFALPTATAILSILYPHNFTVYDVRVCEELQDFKWLGNRRWSNQTWIDYCRFISAVRSAVPENLNLKDADRWLWGKNKQKTLRSELGSIENAD